MNKTKYVLLHDGLVAASAESISELVRIFHVNVFRRVDGNWGVTVNGELSPMSYASTETDPNPMHGFTRDEALRDFIATEFDPRKFNKKYSDYAIYKLPE